MRRRANSRLTPSAVGFRPRLRLEGVLPSVSIDIILKPIIHLTQEAVYFSNFELISLGIETRKGLQFVSNVDGRGERDQNLKRFVSVLFISLAKLNTQITIKSEAA